MIEIKNVRGKTFKIRKGTLDEYVVKENCYNKCNFNKGDVWLDIGGNIGVFPVYYHNKVSIIVSFEPESDNIQLFKENIQLNKVNNCILVEKAIINNDNKEAKFFLNTKKNKGAHSMFVKRGRKEIVVPAININDVLKEVNPNKIKMDIEGGEYDIIKSIDNWDNIEEFIFEYHISVLKDNSGEKLKELYEILNSKFSIINGKNYNELGGNWLTIVHCVK